MADLVQEQLAALLVMWRHGARTLPGLRERVLARFCCLAACVMLNHQLGRASRALVNSSPNDVESTI